MTYGLKELNDCYFRGYFQGLSVGTVFVMTGALIAKVNGGKAHNYLDLATPAMRRKIAVACSVSNVACYSLIFLTRYLKKNIDKKKSETVNPIIMQLIPSVYVISFVFSLHHGENLYNPIKKIAIVSGLVIFGCKLLQNENSNAEILSKYGG